MMLIGDFIWMVCYICHWHCYFFHDCWNMDIRRESWKCLSLELMCHFWVNILKYFASYIVLLLKLQRGSDDKTRHSLSSSGPCIWHKETPLERKMSALSANQRRGCSYNSQSESWTLWWLRPNTVSPPVGIGQRTQRSADCAPSVSGSTPPSYLSSTFITYYRAAWGKLCTSRPDSAGTRLAQR